MLSTIFHDSVNFFYKKILIPEEYVFRLVASVGQKKNNKKQKSKILSPRLPTQNFPSFLFYLI